MSSLCYFAGNPHRENPYPPEEKPRPHCPICGMEIGWDERCHQNKVTGEITGCYYCDGEIPAYECLTEEIQ